MEGVELGDPNNSRLPFLNAQLSQMQLRDYLDTARAAIRESRFEDAQDAIHAAGRLDVADQSEIDAVADELTAALSDRRVDEVLAQANARLDAGRLIAPSNDNARYYFEMALNIDPDNAAARQGLVVVANSLVLQARAEVDAGNFDDAEALLADAARVDPSSADIAATTAALQNARDQRERDIRAEADRAAAERAAEERAAAERVAQERAAAERAEAERIAAAAAAAEQAAADRAAAERRTAELATAQRTGVDTAGSSSGVATTAANSEPPPEQAPAPQPVAQRSVVDESAIQQSSVAVAGFGDAIETASTGAPAQVPEQPAASTRTADPVAASTLVRTRYSAPKYPRTAQRRGVSGWVDVVFTVDIDGSVTDISVRDSDPGDTFVNAATNAVEKWEFEPVLENGVAIQKRAAVRMMFAIE